jgi:hypothetical protein
MKKKRFAVKFFSVMTILCLMVEFSFAGWLDDHCVPLFEIRNVNGTSCEPRGWVQRLPYSGCRGGIGAAGAVVGGLIGGGIPGGLIAVAIGEAGRAVCEGAKKKKKYSRTLSTPPSTPTPNPDL